MGRKLPGLCVGGYLASTKQWESFSNDWQAVLDLEEPRKLDYLKMAEAYLLRNHNSQFYGWSESQRDERLKKLVQTINRHVAHGIISVVPIEPYLRLFRGKFNPQALDRPYFLSFFGVMARLYTLTTQLKLDDRIDFIFDTQGNESKALLMAEYDKFMAVSPLAIQQLSGGPPKFEREQDFKPLQAADMIAWHARRYYYDLYRNKTPEKEPSNVFLANMFLPEHDVLDIWTEDKIQGALDAISPKPLFWGDRRAIPMTLPDPSSPWSWRP